MTMTKPTSEQVTHNGQILKDVLGPVYNVRAFGATGDGLTNDTAAIQAAIDAAANATVYFPAGTYVATVLAVNSPCRLVGPGILKKTTAASSALLQLNTGDIDIDGLEFRGASFGATPPTTVFLDTAIKIYGTSSVSPYRRFNITNVKINGFAGFAMDIRWSEDVTVTGCQISYCGYTGIGFISVIRGILANNRISWIDAPGGSGDKYGIYLSREPTSTLALSAPTEHVNVIGNVVTDIPRWTGIDGHAPHNCNIVGNIVARCQNGIYAQYDSILYAYPSPARFVRISDNVVIGRSTTSENSLGVASLGTSVIGYNESIIIENNLLANSGQAGGAAGAVAINHSRNSVARNNVVYKAVYIGLSMRDSCDRCLMENNVVDGVIRVGISSAIFAYIENTNTNCSFIGNRFRNTTGSASFNCQRGIYYVSANSGTVYARNRIESGAVDVVGGVKRFIDGNINPLLYTDLPWQLETESCPPFTHTATGGAPRESTASQSGNFRRLPAVGLTAAATIRRTRVSYRSTNTTYQVAVRPNEGGDPYVVGVYTVDGTNIAAAASIPDITIGIDGIYWDD